MSVNPVSVVKSVEQTKIINKDNDKKVKKPVVSNLSTRDGVLIAAVPTVLGAGYAAKTYFVRKGKYSVYSDLMTKFAEGTSEHSTFKDCAKLMKKSMRDAKVCGLLIGAAGIVAAGTFALVKMFKSEDTKQPPKNKDAEEKKNIDDKKADVTIK